MKKLLDGRMKAVAAALVVSVFGVVQGATTCTFLGGGVDAKWSRADNWKDGVKPQSGDSVEIPNTVGELTSEIDGDYVLTALTVNATGAVTFSGSGSLSLAKVDVHAPTTFSSGLSVDFSAKSSYAYAGNASGQTAFPLVFDCPVTLTGAIDFCLAGKSTITFNGSLTGAEAQLRPVTGVAWSANGTVTFNGVVTVKNIYFWNHQSASTFTFSAAGNSWEKCQLGYGVVNFTVPTACPPTSQIGWTSYANEQTAVSTGSYVFNGNDITADRLIDSANGSYAEGHNLSSGELWTPTAKAMTLTLNGTADATSDVRLTGKLSLVLNSAGGFTQTLTKRVHTTSGSVTVKAGTLKLTSGSTMASVPAVAIESGSILLNGAGESAFAGAETVAIGETGAFELADGMANPFSSTKTSLVLTEGAKLVVPAGVVCRVKSVNLDGRDLPADTYTGSGATGEIASWIEGGGTVEVSVGGVAKNAVWTGAGEDEKTTTAENWEGGVLPLKGDALTFAAGGNRASLAKDLVASGVVFTASAPRTFEIAPDESAPTATLGIHAGGVSFNGAVAQTNVISAPVAVLDDKMSVDLGANAANRLALTGTVACRDTADITVRANGGSLSLSGENAFSGTMKLTTGGSYDFIGSGALAGLTSLTIDASDTIAKNLRFRGGTHAAAVNLRHRTASGTSRPAVTFSGTNVLTGAWYAHDDWWTLTLTASTASRTVFEGGFKADGQSLRLYLNPNATVVITNTPFATAPSRGYAFHSNLASDGIVEDWVPGTLPESQGEKGLGLAGGITFKTMVDGALRDHPLYMTTPGWSGAGAPTLDLCGHDQSVGRLDASKHDDCDHDPRGIIRSDAAATLTVRQSGGAAATTWQPRFLGGVSLVKDGADELVLAGVNSTTGRLEVAAGRLSFSGNGCWTNASAVVVSGGTLAVDAKSRLPKKAKSYVLSGGTLDLSAGVALRAVDVQVSDGAGGLRSLPAGVYTSANLPDCISGEGSLTACGGGVVLIVR